MDIEKAIRSSVKKWDEAEAKIAEVSQLAGFCGLCENAIKEFEMKGLDNDSWLTENRCPECLYTKYFGETCLDLIDGIFTSSDRIWEIRKKVFANLIELSKHHGIDVDISEQDSANT